MNLFDVHCDTITEIFCKKLNLFCENLAFSLPKVQKYHLKYQVFAFWSDKNSTEQQCFDTFLAANEYLESCCKSSPESVVFCTEKSHMTETPKLHIIKAVEGARLLSGSLDRLDFLRTSGVRILLPLWSGTDAVGGSWDTDEGLTDFGKSLIRECEKKGIIVDASHMSDKSFYDTVKIAAKPIIASHSNSRKVCETPRNLTDEQAKIIADSGGIVGVSLAAKHVSDKYFDRMPSRDDDFVFEVARHILHYVDLVGDKAVCLGCDFDGTDSTLQLPDVSYMDLLYSRLSGYLGSGELENIFFNNAYNFFKTNL